MSTDDENSNHTDCAMWFATDIIGQKWNMQIILELVNAVTHEKKSLAYTEIAALIPDIGSRTLTRRLKYLVNAGIVEMVPNSETPKKVRYRLAKSGLRLIPIISSLRLWSLEFGNTENEICQKNLCRHSIAITNIVQSLDVL